MIDISFRSKCADKNEGFTINNQDTDYPQKKETGYLIWLTLLEEQSLAWASNIINNNTKFELVLYFSWNIFFFNPFKETNYC